jgi:replicative DNA helicase
MSMISDNQPKLVPPVSEDFERKILGLMMLNPNVYDEAIALGLASSDFYASSNRRIFSSIIELAESSRPTDMSAVIEELRRRDELTVVGGAAYVSSLTDGLTNRSSIKHFVKTVREKADQRKVTHACTAGVTAISEGASSRDCIAQLSETLLQISTGSEDAPAEKVLNISSSVYKDWERLADRSGELEGLTTGIESIDLVTTGVRPGETWAIGGRTGDGKSALALQIAAANLRRGVGVAYFSIEMSRDELLQRLWANEENIPFGHIRRPKGLNGETRKRVQSAMTKVSLWPLSLIEDGALSLQKLIAKSRLLIRREKPGLLVVDYLQQISAHAPNERERLTKISNQIRALAKDTGVPVLAVSQLNRPKERDPNERPNKFSLKESGSLENDANTILLIYRPVDEFGWPTGDDEIIVAKQRHGPVSNERVHFDSQTLTFHERNTRVKKCS